MAGRPTENIQPKNKTMDTSKETKDHNTIKEWVEKRLGEPALVRSTGNESMENGGVLRIKFDEDTDELQSISWDEFFKIFDERDLTFLYDTENESRFNKLIYK
jgi:hypothetical protein